MAGVAVMVRDKYAVRLAQEQREELQRLVRGWQKLSPSDRQSADSPEERRRLGRAPSGEALDVALSTVYRVKQRFAEAGLSKFCRTVPRPTGPGSWTTRAEAHPVSGTGQALIALACSPAPEGHAHWTLRLLAGKVVELGLASPCPMRESESV